MTNRKSALMLCALLVGVALSGCRQPEPGPVAPEDAAVTIAVTVEPDPPVTGEAALIVILANTQGQPVAGAQVSVRGDMTHPGMVPVLAEAGCDDAGRCAVPFEWTMGGDWIVDITATLHDGTTAQERFEYSVGS